MFKAKIFCLILLLSKVDSKRALKDESSSFHLIQSVIKALDHINATEANFVVDFSTSIAQSSLKDFFTSNFSINLYDFDNFATIPTSSVTVLVLQNDNQLDKIKKLNVHSVYFVLLIDKISVGEEKKFHVFWKFYALNVNLIFIDIDKVIKMTTFTPFTENKCDNVESKVINFYDADQSIWKSQEIFPLKLKNFHRCPIKLSTFHYPPGTIVDDLFVSGHDIDLLREISKILNFTLQIHVLNELMPWGFLTENGTSGGVMKKVINKEVDIGIGTYFLTKTRAKFMEYSEYSDSKIVLVIPPGKPLNAFEKLFHPLKFTTWIALIFTILIGVFVIFIVGKTKKSVKMFVFGEKTGNPYMNMLSIILNGQQPVQPRKNFSRFLLTIFVIFCIIIRTIYQASLFQFLQSDQKHGEIKTVDELIERGFDVFMYESFQELSNGLKIHQRSVNSRNAFTNYL